MIPHQPHPSTEICPRRSEGGQNAGQDSPLSISQQRPTSSSGVHPSLPQSGLAWEFWEVRRARNARKRQRGWQEWSGRACGWRCWAGPCERGGRGWTRTRGPGTAGRLGEGPSRPTAAPGERLLQRCLRGSESRRACPWDCLQPQLRSGASPAGAGTVPVCVCVRWSGACLEGDPSSPPSLSINMDQLCARPKGHLQASDSSLAQSGHPEGRKAIQGLAQ